MSNHTRQTRRMAGISILTALVVVLQVVATFVKIGAFPVTLTLVPIVVGGALFGARAGAWLGGVFGFVVMVISAAGGDPGGNILWNVNPLLTALLCMAKGILAGWLAALAYKAVGRANGLAGVVTAAIVSPVVNTGTFVIGVLLFFSDVLNEWAAGSPSLVYYIVFGLAGINFVIELALNLVLSSVTERLISYRLKAVPA